MPPEPTLPQSKRSETVNIKPSAKEPVLPHAERVAELLRQGNTTEAARVHNEHLKAEFDRAKQGEVINLSDLMAAREQFDLAD